MGRILTYLCPSPKDSVTGTRNTTHGYTVSMPTRKKYIKWVSDVIRVIRRSCSSEIYVRVCVFEGVRGSNRWTSQ